ncbi:hydrolase [Leeia aquatica]|uniref:Hydrolase n=1 Tax=Leeia aquatica TaxID=2725557 RepID=A0A847SCK6_9NEIS|nr:hydrolase [Leeia aquatica]NLR75216.1 hydrolase [Leeia aquatica]
MLLHRDQSLLLVVDVQEKLLPAIDQADALLQHCHWLMGVARHLGVPILFSEQYPKGLGPTHPQLRALAPDAPVVDKTHFSCVAAACLPAELLQQRRQVVICGMESHVCVLQTAWDLHASGLDVFVVADAIGSRKPLDHQLALQRLQALGLSIVSREMCLFEWAHQAATPEFKQLSQQFLR